MALGCGPGVVALWPILWSDPLGEFVNAFNRLARFPWRGDLLYLGEYHQSDNLPWHYPFVWMAVTIPLVYVGLFLVFGGLGALSALFATGASPGDRLRKLVYRTFGIGMFLVLLGGFGMLARLLSSQAGWGLWIWIKLAVWIALGLMPLVARSQPARAKWLLVVVPLLGAVAAVAVVFKI